MSLHFGAPWARWLTAITTVMIGVAVWTTLAGFVMGTVAMALILLGTAPLSVWGYAVEPRVVRVQRLGWTLDLDLDGLESVEADPQAMQKSWRVFGMGGPFALVGWFRSSSVGPFRAYATDPKRSVVLRWADRTVVVTPDDPETFVTAVEAAAERV